MNSEDDEFKRIEREQALRGVPDAIHHTELGETMEYIQGWNDCRQAMLEQSAQEPVAHVIDNGTPEGVTEWIPFTNRVEPLKTGDFLYATPPPCPTCGAAHRIEGKT